MRLDEPRERGFANEPGQLGDNMTTRGLDLLSLSSGALIRIGSEVTIRVTGLRNPCEQINQFRPGLLEAALDRAASGTIVRKAGIMGTMEQGGVVRPGDPITVSEPASRVPLQVVCRAQSVDQSRASSRRRHQTTGRWCTTGAGWAAADAEGRHGMGIELGAGRRPSLPSDVSTD